MLGKRIMCLIGSINFMISPFNANTLTPFNSATQVFEKQVDNQRMVFQTNKLGMIKTDLEVQIEKDRIKKQKMEERLRKEKELEEQKKNQPEWQEFILTYYSGLQCENSSKGAITCTGKRLEPYMIANNAYSLGTQIYLEGYGEKVVADRGSNKYFSNSNRLDVYIEREPNESDSHYFSRVNKMGVKKTRGYVVKE